MKVTEYITIYECAYFYFITDELNIHLFLLCANKNCCLQNNFFYIEIFIIVAILYISSITELYFFEYMNESIGRYKLIIKRGKNFFLIFNHIFDNWKSIIVQNDQ